MIRILLIFAALLALAGCKEDSPTASRETSPGGIGYTLIHLPGTRTSRSMPPGRPTGPIAPTPTRRRPRSDRPAADGRG
ncbi:MAG: hypothetical protein JKP98_04160 [Rhodobacteraceae bacterium]|nr:hypothetical protein [Paracoccaceae bacterium]